MFWLPLPQGLALSFACLFQRGRNLVSSWAPGLQGSAPPTLVSKETRHRSEFWFSVGFAPVSFWQRPRLGMSRRDGAVGEDLFYQWILTPTSRQTRNRAQQGRAAVGREGRSENSSHCLRTDGGHRVLILVVTFLEEKVPGSKMGERPGFLEPRAGYSKWEIQIGSPEGQGSSSGRQGQAHRSGLRAGPCPCLCGWCSSRGKLLFSVQQGRGYETRCKMWPSGSARRGVRISFLLRCLGTSISVGGLLGWEQR